MGLGEREGPLPLYRNLKVKRMIGYSHPGTAKLKLELFSLCLPASRDSRAGSLLRLILSGIRASSELVQSSGIKDYGVPGLLLCTDVVHAVGAREERVSCLLPPPPGRPSRCLPFFLFDGLSMSGSFRYFLFSP